jgi:hypothetical protein
MEKYNLPYFKEISINQLEEYYSTDIEYKGNKVQLDLNFKEKQLKSQLFDHIKAFLDHIELHDTKNRHSIAFDYNAENGDTVKEYLEFHVEELLEELAGIINLEDKAVTPEKQLLEKLKLVRIGFYPDGKYGSESFATFDYTIDRAITDQLIVVNTDKKGKLINLAWES